MTTDLGLAITMYIVTILYLHNNYKQLLVDNSNFLPILALIAYYISSMVFFSK